jgi:hypothetical protein
MICACSQDAFWPAQATLIGLRLYSLVSMLGLLGMVSLRLYMSLVLRKEWVAVSIVTHHCVGDRHEDIAELEAAPCA